MERFFDSVQANPVFRLLPPTYEIGADLPVLETSDDRMINSKLVAAVE